MSYDAFYVALRLCLPFLWMSYNSQYNAYFEILTATYFIIALFLSTIASPFVRFILWYYVTLCSFSLYAKAICYAFSIAIDQ
jgi:hypothetical protein